MTSAPHGGPDGYLDRVVAILGVFDSEMDALKVGAIAQATGLPVPTAYRLVGELVRIGMLARDPDGRIRLGVRLWELANRGSPLTRLRELARPEIARVHLATGMHANLAVLRDGAVLVVDRIVADVQLPNRTVTAARMPALDSSLGLALLAHAPGPQRRLAIARALAERAGPDQGDGALLDMDSELRATLDGVRRAGYAALRRRIDETTMGIAVPVLAANGELAAAVGIVGDATLAQRDEAAVASLLRQAAARIGAQLVD